MENLQGYRKTWKVEEDEILNEIVNHYNAKNWKAIADNVSQKINKNRTSKQCRERWNNFLKFDSNRCKWTDAQIKLLFEVQFSIGNKWSKISSFFPDKSKNSIKNFYYSTIRRNIRRFNDRKIEEEQIKGPVDEIIKIPEIREILLSHKSCTKSFFIKRKLSADSLEEMRRLNNSLFTLAFNDTENSNEWDTFEPFGMNDFSNEPEVFIDQTILWD
ncbi:hypothetical protein SteCoe_22598 [Stentor coeruleus]|uniref:Myb-like DNA-binding domain containing protein n=1 Tax=Stentor coeruleus TaxID=5963 RepID=A0A1R2BLV5_9CILI|nr:hypothetical protein SteCoe_22598 [Stentor coeruleus]